MDIQKKREAFEKLSEIAEILKNKTIKFVEKTNKYYSYHYSVEYLNGAWMAWQAKAQAVPEKDAVIKKLSDQLYAQEMKASAARVLCETACELLDDYAHQDAMVILNDLEQAMKEPAND